MYSKVLVALENSDYDATILDHIAPLLKMCESEVVLVHVADGFAARNYDALLLAESSEMRDDREYLERIASEMNARHIPTSIDLRTGEPSQELVRAAREHNADLVAMATHGHKGLSDVWHGTTVDKVRHELEVPLLLLKAPKNKNAIR